MLRRRALTVLLLGVAATGCGGFGTPGAASRRPDIILVSIDSLRPDHLGAYGYPRPTSPTIDRLATEGVRFTEAVSTTSWTLPAHAALFTGLYDDAHGVAFDGLRLGDAHVTLAEALRDSGYETAGFFGGPYLHPTFGLGQGFTTYTSCMTRLPDDLSDEAIRAEAWGGSGTSHADVTGPRTLDKVAAFLASTSDERPLFLFLHLWDVHYDYIPPPPYARMFDPDYGGSLTGADFAHNPALVPELPARDRRHLVALYDGEIRFTDEILGRILARFAARRALERTLVVITADHGEEFFEHGGKGHRRSLYDEVVRVPLIVRWPGILPAGRVVHDQVRLIDLLPTILSLAGVAAPSPIQGRDLSPLLRGEKLPAADALLELRGRQGVLRGRRTEATKLLASSGGAAALFDLARDPTERHPLSPAASGFDRRLRRLGELTVASLELRRTIGRRAAAEVSMTPDLTRRLTALGYVGAEPPVVRPNDPTSEEP